MAKTADADLLKAIEGYSTEHKGSKQHEDMISQLKRVQDQVTGKDTAGMSPGKQRAMKAAGNDTMSSEANQSIGDDNKQSNEPAEANTPDKVAAIFGKDGRDDRMTGTEAQRSGGNTVANLPSSGLAPGTANLRRIVADREKSRPDTKMTQGKVGDDNKQNQPAGPTPPSPDRVSAPGAGSLKGGSRAEVKGFGTAATAASEAASTPGGEGRDVWANAAAQAKKRLVAANK